MSLASRRAEEDLRQRKINPIYSAIEAGNYKAALKICAKKDIQNWDMVKVLKAHALQCMGKRLEAVEICREVKAREPTDESVISTLASAFRVLDYPEEVSSCLETAVRLVPESDDFRQELFFCHARDLSFLKQQQVAMGLYKRLSRKHYIFWAATAILLQARASECSPQMLTLGERMVKRALDSNGGKASAEELRLYLELLTEQPGRLGDALEALISFGGGLDGEANASRLSQINDESSLTFTGRSGKLATDVASSLLMLPTMERKTTEANLRVSLGDHGGALQIFIDLSEQYPDEWPFHVGITNNIFACQPWATKTQEDAQAETELGSAAVLDQATNARARCLRLQADNPRLRGPYLAEMELLARLVAANTEDVARVWCLEKWVSPPSQDETIRSETVPGQLRRLILEYLDRFCTKLCCVMDLQPYLAIFLMKEPVYDGYISEIEAERVELERALDGIFVLTRSQQTAGDGEETLPEEIKERQKLLQKHIRACQCRRFLGGTLSGNEVRTTANPPLAEEKECTDQTLQSVGHLVNEYYKTLELNVGLTVREVKQGDELILLATHYGEDIWQGQRLDQRDLLGAAQTQSKALLLLEYGRQLSPHSYHIKLCLQQLYGHIGAFGPGIAIFNDLDVKHIQCDSLSWLLIPGCLACGFFTEALKQCRTILHLHRTAARDAGEYVVKAYSCGNYSKAIELALFQRNKMARSMQLALARVDLARLQLLLNKHTLNDLLSYLREFVGDMVPESVNLSDPEVSALSANHDWSVHLSWDCPIKSRPKDPAHDTDAMALAVRLGVAVPRLLLGALQGDTSPLSNQVDHYRALLEANGCAHPRIDPNQISSLPLKVNEFEAHLRWLSLKAFEASLAINLKQTMSKPSDAKEDHLPDTDEATVMLVSLTEHVQALGRMLCTKQSCGSQDPLPEDGGSPPLQSDWLRNVCCFVSGTGLWLVILAMGMVKDKKPEKKKGRKRGKKGQAAQSSDTLDPCVSAQLGFAAALRVLYSDLVAFLKSRKFHGPGLEKLLFNNSDVQSFFPFLADDEGENEAKLLVQTLQKKVADHVMESQGLSIERLLILLNAKLDVL